MQVKKKVYLQHMETLTGVAFSIDDIDEMLRYYLCNY